MLPSGLSEIRSHSGLSEIHFGVGPWAQCEVLLTPIIGGRSLVDLVTDYEEGRGWELAGIHDGLVLDELQLEDLEEHLLQGRPSSHHDTGVAVLGCTCGVNECLPLLAEVRITDDQVSWGGFQYSLAAGLSWDYSDFGPFEFERAQYEVALQRAMGVALGLLTLEK